MSSITMPSAQLGPERRGARLSGAEPWWGDDEARPEAQVDALTGLANELGWEAAITRGDAVRAARPSTASLITLDVDCVGHANETRGHEFGDELLRTVASLVRQVIRGGDLVARIGGDEFGVLLPGADETACQNVVTRLRDKMGSATSLDGFPLSVAVGFATAAGAETLTKAERWADARMFVDKTEFTGPGSKASLNGLSVGSSV
jgi:diguanylate cyclase (GGDEF)-like protein